MKKTTLISGLLLALAACKEPIPEPARTRIPPKAVVEEMADTAITFESRPAKHIIADTHAKDDEVFIMLPPVSAKESFHVTVWDEGTPKKVKVNYEIGKDTTSEYAQIFNQLDIRFFPEIPLKLDARIESYISRYHAMNAVNILPLKPIISGNLFSFNLEKLQEDKVFNLVIYQAGKKVHYISFEKYRW